GSRDLRQLVSSAHVQRISEIAAAQGSNSLHQPVQRAGVATKGYKRQQALPKQGQHAKGGQRSIETLKSRAQHIVRLDDVEVYSGRKRRRELDGGCEITLSAELNISNRRVLGCPWLPKCAGEIRQPCRIDGAGHNRVAVEEGYLA